VRGPSGRAEDVAAEKTKETFLGSTPKKSPRHRADFLRGVRSPRPASFHRCGRRVGGERCPLDAQGTLASHFATQSEPQKSFVATSPHLICCNKLKRFLIVIRADLARLGLGRNSGASGDIELTRPTRISIRWSRKLFPLRLSSREPTQRWWRIREPFCVCRSLHEAPSQEACYRPAH